MAHGVVGPAELGVWAGGEQDVPIKAAAVDTEAVTRGGTGGQERPLGVFKKPPTDVGASISLGIVKARHEIPHKRALGAAPGDLRDVALLDGENDRLGHI